MAFIINFVTFVLLLALAFVAGVVVGHCGTANKLIKSVTEAIKKEDTQ